jgi:hypothetical protein
MPQQDIIAFYGESFWFVSCFLFLYLVFFTKVVPFISFCFKFRSKKLLNHLSSIIFFQSKFKNLSISLVSFYESSFSHNIFNSTSHLVFGSIFFQWVQSIKPCFFYFSYLFSIVFFVVL